MFRFTDSLAAETKQHGVTVFAISPGVVRTAMVEHLQTSPEGKRWVPVFSELEEDDFTPVEATAELVALIARGKLDRLSGRFIHVRDDLEKLLQRTDEIVEKDLLGLRLREFEEDNAAGEDE